MGEFRGFPNEKELEQILTSEKDAIVRFARHAISGQATWGGDLDETLQTLYANIERINSPEGLKTAGDIFMRYKWYDTAAKCYANIGSKEGWKLAGDAYMKAYYFRYAALCYVLSGMDKKAAGKIAGDGHAKRGEHNAAQICYEMSWLT